VRASQQGRWLALALGILGTLYATAGVVTVLQRVHALAWQVPPPRGRHSPWLVLGVLGGIILIMFSTAAAATARHASPGWGLLATLGAGGVYFGVALAGAWALPRPPIPARVLMPGALLFALGMQAFHVAVVYYFVPKAARSSAAYGSLGVALVLLASLSLLGLLVVAAAEFNAILWERGGAGSSDRPRRTSPSPWSHRSAERGTASRMAGKRPCRVVRAIMPSSLANRAPRQWWMPWPNARWLVSARVMSRVSGLAYRAGSRLAAASEMITWVKAGTTLPPMVTSCVV
jgi:hypothetical protein